LDNISFELNHQVH